jgi:hypothetical protein
MSGFNIIVDQIKQIRGNIIEYLSNDCWGCEETARVDENIFVFQRPGMSTVATIGLGYSMIWN